MKSGGMLIPLLFVIEIVLSAGCIANPFAANQSGKIFIQKPDGTFTATNLVEGNKMEEDLSAIFFDADGDKDLDL